MLPTDNNGMPFTKVMRQRVYDLNFILQRTNGMLAPPHFHAWGAKCTGSQEGTVYTPRRGDWTLVLLGESRAQGSGSTALKWSKVICQGRECMKYFWLLYKLEALARRQWTEQRTEEESRQRRNAARMRRRRQQREREQEQRARADAE